MWHGGPSRDFSVGTTELQMDGLVSRSIAILFEYPTLHGGERSMLLVLERLNRSQFVPTALAPPSGPLASELATRHVRHVPLAIHRSDGSRLPREEVRHHITECIDQLAPDLAHANSLAMGRLLGSVAERTKVPCTSHLRDIIGLSRGAVADLNRNQALIAVSQATREFHLSQGIESNSFAVIPNGINCDQFRPRTKTGVLCRELKVPPSSFVILSVGQICLRKGQDVLAAAAPAIVKQIPNAHFVFAGLRSSTKAETIVYEQNLTAKFAEAGIAGRLHRVGYRNDVARLMNEADLLAHPSKQEPFGRVLLEAAASGLPIVAANVGGTGEIVTDGKSARLIESGDSAALAAAVAEMATMPDRRRQFAQSARDRVAADFTPQAAVDGLVGVWERVCGNAEFGVRSAE